MVPGTNVVYTITVTNTGPSDAANVVVADADAHRADLRVEHRRLRVRLPVRARDGDDGNATDHHGDLLGAGDLHDARSDREHGGGHRPRRTDPVAANNTATVHDTGRSPGRPGDHEDRTGVGGGGHERGLHDHGHQRRAVDCGERGRHGRDAGRADLCVQRRRLPDGLPVRARNGAGRRGAAHDHGDLRGAAGLHGGGSDREHRHGVDGDGRPGRGQQHGDGRDAAQSQRRRRGDQDGAGRPCWLATRSPSASPWSTTARARRPASR